MTAPGGSVIQVNDELLAMTSGEGTFQAPGLERGRVYQYVFRARFTREGRAVAVTRNVEVRAGDSVRIDLGEGGRAEPLSAPRLRPSQATVRLTLPPGARLTVDGEPVEVKSLRPTFVAEGLEPGREYTYTIRATVERNHSAVSLARRITVRAGDEVRVDLTVPNMTARAK